MILENIIDIPKIILDIIKSGKKYKSTLPKPPHTIAVVVKAEIHVFATILKNENSIPYKTETGNVKI